ncbi:Serine/threonine-protein kinase STY46 [Linum perenne]
MVEMTSTTKEEEEDNKSESCGSGAAHDARSTSPSMSPPPHGRQHKQKLEVYNEVLSRLKGSDNEEADRGGFDEELWSHFSRLPVRYALDVNVERAEDVLMHKRLLHLAHDPANRPVIEVRLVQVPPSSDGQWDDSTYPDSTREETAQSSRPSIHPPPAFGSSHNLEALALEANDSEDRCGDHSVHANSTFSR